MRDLIVDESAFPERPVVEVGDGLTWWRHDSGPRPHLAVPKASTITGDAFIEPFNTAEYC